MLYNKRQKCIKEYYNFECNCELCAYEKKKLKESEEKKTLEEYLQKVHNAIFKDEQINSMGLINKGKISSLFVFIVNNLFNKFERYISKSIGV